MLKEDADACEWIWGSGEHSLCFSGDPYLEVCKAFDEKRGAAIDVKYPFFMDEPDYVPSESEDE